MKDNISLDILIGVAAKGGVENVIKEAAAYLTMHNFQVRVVQLVWENYRWLDDSVSFHPLLEGRQGHSVQKFEEVYRAFLESSKQKPDMILATAWPLTVLVARYACKSCGIKPKIISWLHNPIEQYVASGLGGMECLKLADAHFAISNSIAGSIRKAYPDSSIYLVNNPVDIAGLPFTEEHVANTLVFVGRLAQAKQVHLVLEALAYTKSRWEFTVIGEGEEQHDLMALTSAWKLTSQVHWKGWQQQPWELCCHASFAILPSLHEGFPLMMIEAAACGIPTISTPVSGSIDLIEPGVNGYLFPHGSSRDLAVILDFIAEGKLPYLDPQICRAKVAGFEKLRAMERFMDCLLELSGRPSSDDAGCL